MAEAARKTNLELIHSAVRKVNAAVLTGRGSRTPTSGEAGGNDDDISDLSPYDQAVAKAVQSIAQTTAIAIQDGADMLRNVSTVEVTSIGVATAKWIANPTMVAYKEIIDTSVQTIKDAAAAYKEIGTAAYDVLKQFDDS